MRSTRAVGTNFMVDVVCKICNLLFQTKPCLIARGGGKYCSRECTNKKQLKGALVNCHSCGESVWKCQSDLIRSKTKTYFCDDKCRNKWNDKIMPRAEEHPQWKGGKTSYRQRAIREYGIRCMNKDCEIKKAGITIPSKMIEADHIDCNRSNNAVENIKLLCIWCHAKKTREKWRD